MLLMKVIIYNQLQPPFQYTYRNLRRSKFILVGISPTKLLKLTSLQQSQRDKIINIHPWNNLEPGMLERRKGVQNFIVCEGIIHLALLEDILFMKANIASITRLCFTVTCYHPDRRKLGNNYKRRIEK